jgi:surface protein
MFRACGKLKTLDVSSFNTSNVTNMSDMFRRFPGTSLDLSNFNTSKVTNMSRIFSLASNVKEIKVSDSWIVGSTTDVTDMFDGCGVSSVTFI